jgi:uncharacterized ferredoxin-like protein
MESRPVLTRGKKTMIRVGVAAKRMGLVKSDIVLGIPLARA